MIGMLPRHSGDTVIVMMKDLIDKDLIAVEEEAIEQFCKEHDLCPVCINGGYHCTSDHK